MLNIQGKLNYGIAIGEQRYPVEPGNIGFILINSNVNTFLPTLRLEINDVTGRMTRDTQLTDGKAINIKLGQGNVKDFIQYRIFNIPIHRESSTAQYYQINGVLDFVDFLRSIAPRVYKGTSFAVLQEIATELGMRFEGDETDDDQAWLPGNKSYAAFANHIAMRGFVDTKSCMVLCVREDGTMLYKNITELAKKDATAKIFAGAPTPSQKDKFFAVAYRSQNNSGPMNQLLGYSAKIGQELLDGTFNEVAKVTATRFSRSLDINREVKNEIGFIRDELRPIEAGNVHPRFEQAAYQNKRIKATFGIEVDVLLVQESGIDLLDVIELDVPNRANLTNQKPYKSKYLVTAKARVMSGAQYYEKLRLTTTGFS